MKQIDFIAELSFLTSEQGGRKSPAHSGYRPHIEFNNYPEYKTSGSQTYIGKDTASPGETIHAEISILGTAYFSKRLYVNLEFKFCEGSHIIGFGKIIKIVNSNLNIESEADEKMINLNLYPADIQKRLESDFGKDVGNAIRELQNLLKSNKEVRNYRIIRALIYVANKNILHLKKMIELAQTDWRDVLMNAEYEHPDKRVRNFNYEFGKEKI